MKTLPYLIEERFVVSVSDPAEESGKTTHHQVTAATIHDALRDHAQRTAARLIGITERPDGGLGATLWRGERLFRIRIVEGESEN